MEDVQVYTCVPLSLYMLHVQQMYMYLILLALEEKVNDTKRKFERLHLSDRL